MHPEVSAWLEVERWARRRRQGYLVLGVTCGLIIGLFLKGAAHRLLGDFEPHWGAALELGLWIGPVPVGLSAARHLYARWLRLHGPGLLARVAATFGIDAATLREALEAA